MQLKRVKLVTIYMLATRACYSFYYIFIFSCNCISPVYIGSNLASFNKKHMISETSLLLLSSSSAIFLYYADSSFEEFKDPKVKNDILQEYNDSAMKKGIDEEINNELISANEKVTYPSTSEDDFHLLNYDKLVYLQSAAGDPFMYDLIQLIVRNDKVRIRMMKEIIEAEQDDPYMPDEWIYHKDLKLSDVLKYIRNGSR